MHKKDTFFKKLIAVHYTNTHSDYNNYAVKQAVQMSIYTALCFVTDLLCLSSVSLLDIGSGGAATAREQTHTYNRTQHNIMYNQSTNKLKIK